MCYEFKKLNFKKGFFDEISEATFIITLVNSKRFDNINKQLNNYSEYFGNNTFIVFNKGYNCKKNNIKKLDLYKNKEHKTASDLAHCYYTIFKYVLKHNFKKIIILEDDFEFSKIAKDKKHILNIKNFTKNNKFDIYSFSSVPISTLPTQYHHTNFRLICGGSHAQLYSYNYIKNTVNKYEDSENKYFNWNFDGYVYNTNSYNYKYPLIYQKFSETENKKIWGSQYFGISNLLIYLLKLDTGPDPGYKILQQLNDIIFILFVLFIVWFCTSK